jgi:hypothetical protein
MTNVSRSSILARATANLFHQVVCLKQTGWSPLGRECCGNMSWPSCLFQHNFCATSGYGFLSVYSHGRKAYCTWEGRWDEIPRFGRGAFPSLQYYKRSQSLRCTTCASEELCMSNANVMVLFFKRKAGFESSAATDRALLSNPHTGPIVQKFELRSFETCDEMCSMLEENP